MSTIWSLCDFKGNVRLFKTADELGEFLEGFTSDKTNGPPLVFKTGHGDQKYTRSAISLVWWSQNRLVLYHEGFSHFAFCINRHEVE